MTSDPSPPTYHYDIRIPKDRIAIIIGKDGEIKKRLEQETSSTISVDSHEGDITVTGEDVLKLYQIREIIKAIGRGFNPELALLLLNPDYSFELISLLDYTKQKNHHQRMKGRVIGRAGKTREIIEELCEVHVSVYGKTIGIIGTVEHVSNASRAIDMLLSGSPHTTVYKWLEQKRRVMKKEEILGTDDGIKDEYKKYIE